MNLEPTLNPYRARDNFKVYQIYYDEATKNSLDPGFIPLDNTANLRPDWYEFWVILNFLETHKLDQNNWYGFLSPKFKLKTGLTSSNVYEFLEAADSERYDVAIVSPDWDRGAYYLNPFEQGEVVHPGLLKLSQAFLDTQKLNINLKELVCHSQSTVFCNFVIAKASYWTQWHQLSKAFFKYVEDAIDKEAQKIAQNTNYPSPAKLAPMKTFIQERFPSILLSNTELKVANLNLSDYLPIFEPLFHVNENTRKQLQLCDDLKRDYAQTLDSTILKSYFDIRSLISTKF